MLSLGACSVVAPPVEVVDEAANGFRLRLIGERTLDHRLSFGGTIVGGLSGIDRDPVSDVYYLISDDHSVFAPTRFYTARLSIDEDGFHDVALQRVVTLSAPDGRPYAAGAADAEAIRYDPFGATLWWTSEGARGRARRVDPFVRRSRLDGSYAGEVPLDPMFGIVGNAVGPRDNLVFEGASLSPDGRSLWIAMEAPLLEDGPLPTMAEGAWTRLSRHDRRLAADPVASGDGGFGPLAAQFAYRVGPIPSAGAWTASHAQNGVSEILALDATRLLVLERAFVLGPAWRIRLFVADVRDASDVRTTPSLIGSSFVPTTKRLLLDFDTLGIRIDNLEGLCFGPTLANGHRTLVLVSDDNFDPGQATQLLAFEMLPT